jgi:hypothetical protein
MKLLTEQFSPFSYHFLPPLNTLLSQILSLGTRQNKFDPEDEGSIFLRNIGIHWKVYTVSQVRRSSIYVLPFV